MPTFRHYTVSLTVDGEALKEYDIPTDEKDKEHHGANVIKYVEAIKGAEFQARLEVRAPAEFPTGDKCIWVSIDGQNACSKTINSKRHYRASKRNWVTSQDGRYFSKNGKTLKQALQFGDLITTEETGDFESLQKIAKEAGTIRFKIYDVDIRPSVAKEEQPIEYRSIPEKALKGQPIDVSAGLETAIPISNTKHRQRSSKVGHCLATFVLKYRSRKALQVLEIIPADPVFEHLRERDLETPDLEQARRLLAQYREAEDMKSKVKVKSEQLPTKRAFIDDEDEDCQIVSVKKLRSEIDHEVDVLDLT